MTVRAADRELAAAAGARREDDRRSRAGASSTQVLGDWVDPDGDAFYLDARPRPPSPTASATSRTASSSFTDSGAGRRVKTVDAHGLRRHRRPAAGSLVDHRAAGRRGADRRRAVRRARLRRPGGHASARSRTCAAATAPSGSTRCPRRPASTIEPSFETGTFTLRERRGRARTTSSTWSPTATQTATGLVRDRRRRAAGREHRGRSRCRRPIFVTTLSSADRRLADDRHRPRRRRARRHRGASNVPAGRGIRAEVLDQRVGARDADAARSTAPVDVQLPHQQRARRGRGHDHGRRDPAPAISCSRRSRPTTR